MKTAVSTQLLKDFIAIPSISGASEYASEVSKAAEFLKTELEKNNITVTLFSRDNAPPLVVGVYTVSPDAPTVCIYGHYDVQAVDPIDEWLSDPFTVTEREGKMYARGVADNKGHIIQNILAVSQAIQDGSLANNIVFLLEGEEESGSAHFEELVQQAKDVLKPVDLYLITDTGMEDKETPQIYYALRGLVYGELTITTAGRDLHSGIYGNVVANPANILVELMATMKNSSTGEITVEGLYESVRTPDTQELSLLVKSETTNEELTRETGSNSLRTVRGYAPYLTGKILPSFDIHGIRTGFTGEGSKTVIPRTASVKFSCRLVEHQDPDTIAALLEAHIKKNLPEDIEWNLVFHSKNAPFYTDFRHPLVEHIAKVLESEFGNPVQYNRSGGSIPAAEVLQRIFHKPVVLTGFTLPDDNIHSPNENMDSQLFGKGVEVLKKIYATPLK